MQTKVAKVEAVEALGLRVSATVEAYEDLGTGRVEERDLAALAERRGYIEARKVA